MHLPHRLIVAILLAAPATLLAQAPDPCATAPQTCATLIATHATAQTRIANTAVDVTVSITGAETDLPTIERSIAAKSATLLKYLRGQKVERLITLQVQFTPQTKFQKNDLNKTVGYNGSLQVSFRTTPEKSPEVLAGVLAQGANNIASTNFTATEAEIAAARRDLAAEATRNAITEADAIAKAAGLHVSAIRDIQVDTTGAGIPRPRMMAYAMVKSVQMDAVETAAGDQALSVNVNVITAAVR
jgi:uncharacterized protein YggE